MYCNPLQIAGFSIDSIPAGGTLVDTTAASNGVGSVTYLADTVPAGFSFNTANAAWSGNSATPGTYVITISGTDSAGCTGLRTSTTHTLG